MDFQRIFTLLGLAVTAYMLVLAWNEDYGQRTLIEEAPIGEVTTPQLPTLPGETTQTQTADEIPDASELSSLKETFENQTVPKQITSNGEQLVTVNTDVLQIAIDLRGGDIKRASLSAFPEQIDTPDIPFPLIDPRNNYAAQSGLIGKNGTDTAKGRPRFTTNLGRPLAVSVPFFPIRPLCAA